MFDKEIFSMIIISLDKNCLLKIRKHQLTARKKNRKLKKKNFNDK